MSYLKQFYVTGRNFPNQKKNQPDVYFMKIFANNENIAKSRFWYFLKKLKKVKKIKGEIISIKTIYDKKVEKTRNFGIWLRYDSRTGTTNIFKEYRDVCAEGAVEQMYLEMAGKHRANWDSIIVLRVEEMRDSECIRPHIKQFHGSNIRFPNFHFNNRNSSMKPQNIFSIKYPITTLNI